jgi:hypothetical protein
VIKFSIHRSGNSTGNILQSWDTGGSH